MAPTELGAYDTCKEIADADFLYMSVTNSPDGEYTSSVDVCVPIVPGVTMRADVIDLSHWDNVTDGFAGTVRMGVLGVINKATEGLAYTDPSFGWRREPCKRAGLLYGAYHFIRPGDPNVQAGRFLRNIGDAK